MTGGLLIGAVIFWIVPIFVARSQGRAKGRDGLFYGLLLGWLGVLILAVLPEIPEPEKQCPYCAEWVKLEASVCRFCGHEIGDQAESHTGPVPLTHR